MFTFDGWVTRVAFELHWALETRLHASALDSELRDESDENNLQTDEDCKYFRVLHGCKKSGNVVAVEYGKIRRLNISCAGTGVRRPEISATKIRIHLFSHDSINFV